MNGIYLKFVCPILILLASTQAQAQFFACQYTDSTGFNFESGRWAVKAAEVMRTERVVTTLY
jgi:hypothetical protein